MIPNPDVCYASIQQAAVILSVRRSHETAEGIEDPALDLLLRAWSGIDEWLRAGGWPPSAWNFLDVSTLRTPPAGLES